VFGLGPWELVIILVIVVLIFGVGKLPELGSGLGEGIKNFRKSFRDAKPIDITPEPENDSKENDNNNNNENDSDND